MRTCGFCDHFVEYFASNDDKSWIKSAWSFHWLCVTLWFSATVASNFVMDTDNFRRKITTTQWIDRGLSSHKALRRNLAINYDGTAVVLHSICRYCACLITLVELSSCDKDTQSEGWRVKGECRHFELLFILYYFVTLKGNIFRLKDKNYHQAKL
jgi:hypothetical protein